MVFLLSKVISLVNSHAVLLEAFYPENEAFPSIVKRRHNIAQELGQIAPSDQFERVRLVRAISNAYSKEMWKERGYDISSSLHDPI